MFITVLCVILKTYLKNKCLSWKRNLLRKEAKAESSLAWILVQGFPLKTEVCGVWGPTMLETEVCDLEQVTTSSVLSLGLRKWRYKSRLPRVTQRAVRGRTGLKPQLAMEWRPGRGTTLWGGVRGNCYFKNITLGDCSFFWASLRYDWQIKTGYIY